MRNLRKKSWRHRRKVDRFSNPKLQEIGQPTLQELLMKKIGWKK
jgi:hypothetical protein